MSGRVEIRLVAIERDGVADGFEVRLPEAAEEAVRGTVRLYDEVGYEEPWVGYLAIADRRPVGTCGFKSPPAAGRVEIAYFTFPGFEGRGVATAMASELVRLAWRGDPELVVAAQTLPRPGASTRVLEKLGFRLVGSIDHPEDGEVWEWRLAPERGAAGRS